MATRQTSSAEPAEEELESELDAEDDEEGWDAAADEADEEDEEEAPVSAASRASAKRLLDLLVEKNALVFAAKKKPGSELIDGVARVIDATGSVTARASRLSDTIVDADEVDELFVDDATLAELLKRW